MHSKHIRILANHWTGKGPSTEPWDTPIKIISIKPSTEPFGVPFQPGYQSTRDRSKSLNEEHWVIRELVLNPEEHHLNQIG